MFVWPSLVRTSKDQLQKILDMSLWWTARHNEAGIALRIDFLNHLIANFEFRLQNFEFRCFKEALKPLYQKINWWLWHLNLTHLLLAQPVSSQQDKFHQVNGKQRRKVIPFRHLVFFIKLEMCWLQLSATPFRITLILSNYGRPITHVTRWDNADINLPRCTILFIISVAHAD